MIERRYHVQVPGSVVGSVRQSRNWIPIRGFVVAFVPEGTVASDPAAFAQRMTDVSRRLGKPTHLHGVFVAGNGYFRTRPIDPRTAKPEDWLPRRVCAGKRLIRIQGGSSSRFGKISKVSE